MTKTILISVYFQERSTLEEDNPVKSTKEDIKSEVEVVSESVVNCEPSRSTSSSWAASNNSLSFDLIKRRVICHWKPQGQTSENPFQTMLRRSPAGYQNTTKATTQGSALWEAWKEGESEALWDCYQPRGRRSPALFWSRYDNKLEQFTRYVDLNIF